ncbi:hypothetical protein [Thermomonospora umbrina]|uniref:Uncharacterized protein n=1 Tax=Thermomonospora umbrina TaxID=111806 RepID=A0A3D9SM86_9ACTN|nr:hypothetical protein [Thermomonospora umbrina]REE96958.1 hypothetical protein DFJ69_2411 [Thermomonospora umbrina]
MSFDRRLNNAASVDQPVLTNDRRTFLRMLDETIRSKPGLACGIVTRAGLPVLHVINSEMPRHAVEIGADFTADDWWFTWAVSGNAIGPVDDPESVTDMVARALKVYGEARP